MVRESDRIAAAAVPNLIAMLVDPKGTEPQQMEQIMFIARLVISLERECVRLRKVPDARHSD